jgi:poly(ADP-ribose) glycohydrolase ARH3
MQQARGANEDTFLGALLGIAIGDALGMPVEGWPAARIAERFGRLDGYRMRVLPDGTEIEGGEFTDESEVALSIVESLTTNRGELDPDLVGARMVYLANGESRRWLGEATKAALDRADTSGTFEVPLREDDPATGDVASRGVPIGLLYAVGRFDEAGLRRDAERVTRLTHGSPAAIAATTAVAFGVNLAGRGEIPPREWVTLTGEFLTGGELAEALGRAAVLHQSGRSLSETLTEIGTGPRATESVPAAFVAAMSAAVFEDAVLAAVNAGGAAGTTGAIAGAIAGARFGASGIPQGLIDDLGSRIYVSLAAPWFHRAALQRAGLLIDLRPDGGNPPPRPSMPPRV